MGFEDARLLVGGLFAEASAGTAVNALSRAGSRGAEVDAELSDYADAALDAANLKLVTVASVLSASVERRAIAIAGLETTLEAGERDVRAVSLELTRTMAKWGLDGVGQN